ncbi:hypothetical protein K450DRAFT_249846 [Umbelopsis ramanniana AG]|uniref:Uncharacterized protein n=1 Tax=Umbelopsis ramanniana AG TaxID=1314678 RepID=A0AAD5E726_UMBRA|nr:uncharacterized protein K450DRAFT_249846 [Umbelopsis ramanniana AG]KAI8577909.1 hypothetical protein K450DRAFT_249846 [Umbelopsis ramanniana AG]
MLSSMKLLVLALCVFSLMSSVSCNLEKRQCSISSCSCQGVVDGLFCGDGRYNCKEGRLYECQNGGRACDYGVHDSCAKCNHLTC